MYLCIHVEKIKGPAQFRTKALMPQYKKSYARCMKKIMHLCINRDFRGGLTIQNGENREFLSVSRVGASHLRRGGRNNANAVPLHEWMVS